MKIKEIDSYSFCFNLILGALLFCVLAGYLIYNGYIILGLILMFIFAIISVMELYKDVEITECKNGVIEITQHGLLSEIKNVIDCREITDYCYGGNGQGLGILLKNKSTIWIPSSLGSSVKIKKILYDIKVKNCMLDLV